MTSESRIDARTLAEAVDRDLRARGGSERAQKEKAYLKSELIHFGVSVPDTRAVVRAALRGTRLSHDDVTELVRLLWAAPTESSGPVHERRAAATMVLIQSQDRLGAGDTDLIESLLREAKTWALVDPLAGDLVGPLSEQDPGFDPVLERWAHDDDFWIRRSALLAPGVRTGSGAGFRGSR